MSEEHHMDISPGFQSIPPAQSIIEQHLYCNKHGRLLFWNIATQHARKSILAGLKKVYKHPKWGMERRVAKRCGSVGTCKERDNSMLSPITVHGVAWTLSVHDETI
jgi:hypothetical protein